MNRQEALKKLKNYFYWNYDDEEYDQEVEEKHKQNLEDIIKYLKQPITLIDYLGWEEGVEYDVLDERYKVVDKKLYWFDEKINEWRKSCYDEELINFQQAKKIPEKYFLRLKEKYRKFYGIMNNFYLNFNKETTELSILDLKPYKEYQTQFTKEEIEEIKKIDYINFEQFEIVKVEEDE